MLVNKKIQSNSFLKKIIFFMFLFFIPIDMINGVLIRNNYFSIAIIYKLIVLGLISIYLIKQNKFFIVFTSILILSIYIVIHTINLDNVEKAINGLNFLVKYLGMLLFYYFFITVIKNTNIDKIFFIVKIAFSFLVLNLILGGVFNFGYPMYGQGESSIGSRGFIYAGNEISAALISSGAILMMQYLKLNNYIKFFFIGILMLISSIIITSKVSILGTLLLLLFFPIIKFFSSIEKLKINKKVFIYSIVLSVIMPFISIQAIFFLLYKSNLIERLAYFYNKVDLITLIFSSRNIWAYDAIKVFLQEYSLLELFFGTSLYWQELVPVPKFIEIDLLDFLMTYGLFGVIITYGAILFILFKIFFIKSIYKHYLTFIILLLVALSLTSGHIFTSGTSGFLFAIIFSMLTLSYESKK